jgi:PPE-repeat protein
MIEFGALPPEINSARMYAGPGPATLLSSMAAWQSLTVELGMAGESINATISTLAASAWMGPSALAMAAAAQPFIAWLEMQTVQAQMAALAAGQSAEAHSTAFAAHVPPPAIEANRDALMAAVAGLPWTAPAVAALEAEYQEMWAQDASAMYAYSAQTTEIANALAADPFTPPTPMTDPAGLADQAAAVGQSAGQSAGQAGSTVGTASDQVSSMGSGMGSLGSVVQAPMSAAGGLSQTFGQLPQAMSGAMSSMTGLGAVNGGGATVLPSAMLGAARFTPSGMGAVSPGIGGGGSPVTAMMGNSGRLGSLSAPRMAMTQAGWTQEETSSIRTLSVTPAAAAPETETTTAQTTPRPPLVPAMTGGSNASGGGGRTVLPRASITKRMVF